MFPFRSRVATTKWLYVPMEVQVREMTSKFLLSCVAAENGFSCIIGEGTKMQDEFEQLPEGIAYVNACGSGVEREKFFDQIKNNGHKIVANDEETMGLFKDAPAPWLKGRLSEPLFEMIDQYHVWGQRQADMIQGYMKCSADVFRITGTYRADLWKYPLCEIHRATAEKLRRKYGHYILLSSNFTMRFDLRGAEHHLQLAKDYGEVIDRSDEQSFWEMIDHNRSVADDFVKALGPISAAFPDHTVIVRPHPTEGVELWKQAIGDIPRVHVVYEGEASPWLLGADAIFHNGCTNAFEARLMGKIPVTYRPTSNADYDETFLFGMGPIADNVEELIQYLGEVISRKDEFTENDLEFNDYVYSNTQELACDRIISAIDEIDIKSQPLPFSISSWAYAVKEDLRSKAGLDETRTIMKTSGAKTSPPKWPGIRLREIKMLLKELQTHLNRFENVEVLNYKRRLFIVRQKKGKLVIK